MWLSSSAGLEYLTTNQGVVGSSPSWVTIGNKDCWDDQQSFFCGKISIDSPRHSVQRCGEQILAGKKADIRRNNKENKLKSYLYITIIYWFKNSRLNYEKKSNPKGLLFRKRKSWSSGHAAMSGIIMMGESARTMVDDPGSHSSYDWDAKCENHDSDNE